MPSKFDAFQIAKRFHWACKELPLRHSIKDQIVRASHSVALNLAEGSAKRTPKDQRRYYTSALASLRECHAIIEIEGFTDPELLQMVDRLGAILFTLTKKLSEKIATDQTAQKNRKNRTEHRKPQTPDAQPKTSSTTNKKAD